MAQSSVSVEEQLILKSIKDEQSWDNLPKRLKASFITAEEWNKR